MLRNLPLLTVPVVWSGLAFAAPAFAQEVNVELNIPNSSYQELANALGTSVSDVEAQIRTEVEALYGLLNLSDFLRLSANAQTLVTAGTGADYASNPQSFFFGFGVNAAVEEGTENLENPRDIDVNQEVPASAGVMMSLMAGYNFKDQGADFLTVSIHGLHIPRLDFAQLEGEFTNIGAHVQFKLFRPNNEGFNAVEWGGIDLTTGFNYARTTLRLGDEYEADDDLASNVRLETVSRGTLELVQTSYTIPFEVTSNLTLFEFLTLFGGVGLDVPLGNASIELELDTDIDARIDGERVELGDGTLQARGEADSDDLLPRALVGLQLNIWALRVFTQLNIGFRDTAVGLAAGVRLVL